jgi:hypothetical protein
MVKKMRTITRLAPSIALSASLAAGCGIEGFIAEGTDDSHPVPGVGLTGTSILTEP